MSDAAEWDAIYAERHSVWSGEPNAQLVAEVTSLTPGTALDVGCGEGADAIWLSQQGWDVTAVDISQVALGRAGEQARATGVDITFQQADLVTTPPAGSYDLVSAQFFHLPDPPRAQTYRGLGAAVRAGGHLLVVGHYPSEHIGKDHPERLFANDEIVALFPEGWDVVTSQVRERRAVHHGELRDLVDGVVLLRHRG
ncbi:class I SAM-dependent methyltransferase [Aeromicrobium sp. NPDC092404]|uniref:class I SAM-dependent methyltransferase n=1 Tax=Aeromicrobium sp. NPDC092404 TaxID=3154976 RepID=UPI003438E2C9